MAHSPSTHVPVLAAEISEWLDPQPGQVLVDGTLGGGGHTRLLAERLSPNGLVVAMDRDPAAIDRAADVLAGLPVTLVHSDFAELPETLAQLEIPSIDGVLLDLGLSSDQLADEDRGFSYDASGPLDLRFDPGEGRPAWQLLQRIGADKLAALIFEYGEERHSRRIARKIVECRRSNPIRTARDLAELIRRCAPRSKGHRIDPATRTFQALRIAVNGELASLATALQRIPECVAIGGRVAVISFHSLEDRIVKTAFRDDGRYVALTKKPIRPNQSEVQHNPRSRSARLRVAEVAASSD